MPSSPRVARLAAGGNSAERRVQAVFTAMQSFISFGALVLVAAAWGKSKKVYYCGWWESNPRPKKTMVLPMTPFVEKLVRY